MPRAVTPHGRKPRILLTTEGTYPYAVGGVSSWCDLLVRGVDELDWQILPIVAPHGKPPAFALPPHASQVARIEVWSESLATGARPPLSGRAATKELPARLLRHLIGWDGDPAALVRALLWCRRYPAGVRAAFRSRRAWDAFLRTLSELLDERLPGAGVPPAVDVLESATLYQTLYWVARTAAVQTPETDVLLVTAAGWAAVPALVHRALHGTPLVLAEHGVYVREAYLAAVRSPDSPGSRFISTRLARGLSRAAYAGADIVTPVTEANTQWELALGIAPEKIRVIRNGLRQPSAPVPLPGTRTVVSVGRIDPLKDIHLMLRVAKETLRHVPDATFRFFGPVTAGQEAYGRSCQLLHEQLGLGDAFRFMGRTTDPDGAVRDADVVLMTSISEGLPMAILEAMGQGRPIVSTSVGGVPDVVRGCGIVTPPGDVHGLARAVATLLRNPALARDAGRRGYERLGRRFNEGSCVEEYRDLLHGLASGSGAVPVTRAPTAAAA
jgi:glycosyltransferase involved in cell wall biosynthesis